MSKRVLTASAPALAGLIDYAGLFPPAGLGMAETVRNYATYSAGQDSALLGRLIVPAARLEEFAQAAGEMAAGAVENWRLSVLPGANAEADIARAAGFAEACNRTAGIRVTIDCVDTKISSADGIQSVARAMPAGWIAYFEIPFGNGSAELIAATARAGACAKMRTGGVTAEGFPKAEDISQFIFECAAQGVRFKATAGLHHAIRSVNRFTYEKDSPSGWMHGFLNVLLASGIALAGRGTEQITEILEEKDARALRFEEDGVRWKDLVLSYTELARMRETLFASFGSCSFTEPTSELHSLQIP